MININSFIAQLLSPRIPRLYYGPSNGSQPIPSRVKRADHLFIALKILSEILFVIGGIIGFFIYQLYGLLIGVILGYSLGAWMRRSLGVRGRKATLGFFIRMKERLNGSRPGILETLLEHMAGQSFPPEKCREILATYEQSVKRLKHTDSKEEQNHILAEFDHRVHRIANKDT